MAASIFKKNNPTLGFEYLEVNIPKLTHFGTGTYTCITQPNALNVPFPITCAATSKPTFQILLSVFPGTGEILILLGRVDNNPPLSSKIYQSPQNLDYSRSHIFNVTFSNWNIETLILDKHRIQEKSLNTHFGSNAQRYIKELHQIASGFQSSFHFNKQEPLLEQVHPASGLPISFFQTQKILIEELFGIDWLLNASSNTKKHPAYKRWKLCNNLLNTHGNIQLSDGSDILFELVKMLADNQFIVICTKGRLDNFSIGSIANYGDANVQKRIQAVISNPSQYLDVITELSFAASQITRKHEITAFEKSGFPDFSISIPGWQLPFAVDCKRLKRDTSQSRIGTVIKKVNKQIKALDKPCHGLAVLDVSEKVDSAPILSDDIPKEILAIKSNIAHAISEFNTSVSAVLLLWDQFTILEKPKIGEKVITIWLRRRYELIQHNKPKYPLDGDVETISVGNTVMIALNVALDIPLPVPIIWRPI